MGKFGPFILGGLLGAAAALLYTPRTGEEMRAVVADKANEAWGQAQQAGSGAADRGTGAYGAATDAAQQAYSAASATAGQVYQTAQDIFGHAAERMQEMRGSVAPQPVEANDELREKIEAARIRIANQVAASAGAAAQAADTTINVEATVEDVPGGNAAQ